MPTAEPPPLVWIASFVAVVDHGTFTAAAQALNRSQPRVSSHIASLERAVGARLLERRPHGAQLTRAGAVFLPHARGVLRELRHGLDAVGAHTSRLQGRLRVGSYPGAMAVIMAPLVQRFQTMYPGVWIDLREAEPIALEEAVANQEIDLALRTSDVPQRFHEVPSVPLFDEHIILVVRHDDPQARSTNADTARLRSTTVIVSGTPSGGWSDYRDRLDQEGVEPRHMITVGAPTTLVALVRAGIGVGLLGALAAGVTVYDEEIVTVPLSMPLWRREIRMYRPVDAPPDPVLDAFVRLLRREGPSLTAGRATWPEKAT